MRGDLVCFVGFGGGGEIWGGVDGCSGASGVSGASGIELALDCVLRTRQWLNAPIRQGAPDGWAPAFGGGGKGWPTGSMSRFTRDQIHKENILSSYKNNVHGNLGKDGEKKSTPKRRWFQLQHCRPDISVNGQWEQTRTVPSTRTLIGPRFRLGAVGEVRRHPQGRDAGDR